jgi:Zn-dependent peptidase ImmA (M78 family)
MYGRDVAHNIISKYGTREPIELADRLNYIVIDFPLPAAIRGAVLRFRGNIAIGLNSSLDRQKKRETLAHEIGHAIMHNGIGFFFMVEHTYQRIGSYEREANEFAAELLIPDEILWNLREESVEYAAKTLMVSKELFTYKYIMPNNCQL